jgi:arylsulfatase A-like enzyme
VSTGHRRRAFAAFATLVLVACGADPEPPSLVVVTLDTVRADHLGCYGYPRPTSPHLDAFAKRATRFERALATSPWTVPSHASLFTGLYPFEHGAVSFLPEGPVPRNVSPLDPARTTLAEALAREGYVTAAFVANAGFLHPSLGLDQGFALYAPHREAGRNLNARIFAWLDAVGDRPFFLFVNYMDAHRPYNTAPLPGAVAAERDPALLDRLREHVARGAAKESLTRRVIDQYDLGIGHADAAFGALAARLDAHGRVAVIVTSDHGEYFGEHGLVEHSKDVYEPGLRIPLLVRAPGQERGAVRAEPVSLVHVPWLAAEALGGGVGERLGARFPRAPGDEPLLAENYYSRTPDLRSGLWGTRFERVRRAAYAGPLKLITSSDGRNELYDLETDPAETRDLAEERAAQIASWMRELDARLGAPDTRRPAAPAPTADELAELRALGYAE